jgi:hypothetical protein
LVEAGGSPFDLRRWSAAIVNARVVSLDASLVPAIEIEDEFAGIVAGFVPVVFGATTITQEAE